MRVAIVHDDLVQWGGAERALEGLCEIFPNAPIFTSVFDYSNSKLKTRFANKKIITTFLQKIPLWRNLYKVLLPLYPLAFEQFSFDDFDLVISHTTRFAKSIITKPKTKHVCYLHTPPRFLWRFDHKNYGISELLMSKLRIYDQIASNRVDFFIAGSKNAQKKIQKIYRKKSKIVYPFVDLKRFENIEPFDGGYFLVIARPNKYKRVELAQKACSKLGVPLKIIRGQFDDEIVAKIISGCRALIIPGVEDFGLVSLEAQALGKPVVAFREGGVLESIIEGKTGIFFNHSNVDSLTYALRNIDYLDSRIRVECIENAKRFSKEVFVRNFEQTIAPML